MSADAAKVALLEEWMRDKEGENLEFKEWKTTDSDFDKLARYCTVLANEGGGRLIAGVTDKRPRKVVGSLAFSQPEQTRKSLAKTFHCRSTSRRSQPSLSQRYTVSDFLSQTNEHSYVALRA